MNIKHRWILFSIFTFVSLLWMAFIFSNSAQTAVDSSADSQFLLNVIRNIFSFLHLPFDISEGFLRKCGHFAEFTALGLLLGLDISSITKSIWGRIFAPFSFGALSAMADETIQLFVEGRSCEVRDVIIDSGGISAGIALSFLVVLIINKIIKKRREKKQAQSFK